ncbi:hypothetical protein ACVWZA_001313 [Sphingomonas sp. UYAg733]
MRRGLVLALLLVAACSRQPDVPKQTAAAPATGLEAAAIEAGVIPDPNGTDITGLYARDTDRMCVVPTATAYRIGVYVDYGEDQNCGGSGVVTRVGEALNVDFPDAPGCNFDARFEGDGISFPGKVPDGCAKLCSRRASLAALDVDRLSESVSEASTLRDAKGKLLCSGG